MPLAQGPRRGRRGNTPDCALSRSPRGHGGDAVATIPSPEPMPYRIHTSVYALKTDFGSVTVIFAPSRVKGSGFRPAKSGETA